jgi:molecular chaperone Hsp33
MATIDSDFLLPFHVETGAARGRLVRLGPVVARCLRGHDYPPPVADLLSQALALAAALAGSLKYDGLFTLQIQGDGPVNMVVADVGSDGAMRGIARFDAARVAAAEATAGGMVPRYLGAGHLAFTVDQGPDTDRYQGIVGLEGATLADCAHAYFRASEQIETAIVLAASGPAAAGLMVQRMPAADLRPADDEQAEEDWRRTVILASSVTPRELLDPGLSGEKVLERLFHQERVRVFRGRPLRYACRCSRERVVTTLRSFPRPAVEEMVVDGRLTVTCEFCKTEYVFDEAQVAALFTP